MAMSFQDCGFLIKSIKRLCNEKIGHQETRNLFHEKKCENIRFDINDEVKDILKKLRVALHLRNDEIVEILQLVDFKVTTSELGALFRNEDHPKYKECGDQLLRNFLNGLIIHMRGPMEPKKEN